MKKILALVLALIMILSFASCGQKDNTDTGTDSNTAADSTVTNDDSSENAESSAATPAAILLNDFKGISDLEQMSTEDIANKLVSNPVIEFQPVVVPAEPGYLAGFSEEISGFDSASCFSPMIGSIPFVGYVFSVSSDADAFVKQLKGKADLRWNICTQADEMVCEAVGNTVFFVMSPASFEE